MDNVIDIADHGSGIAWLRAFVAKREGWQPGQPPKQSKPPQR
jgi:hypothetical protein